MKMRAFWMFGVALILAGVSVFLARNWLESQIPAPPTAETAPQIPVTRIVVATTPMHFGNTIRREHLKLVEWPASATPEGAFHSVSDILAAGEERVALRSIEVNEPVLTSKVSGFGGRATLSAIISRDMRATTIRVNDIHGVAGFVLPGDRVDILLTRSKGDNNLITDVLLQSVLVLAIDQDASEARDKPAVVKAVTLEVTTEQAQKLALAQQLGTLSLALRNVANVDAEEPLTITVGDLSVGEANTPGPAVKEAKAPTVTAKPMRKPLAFVRIVRGMQSTEYDVEPERRRSRRPPTTTSRTPQPASVSPSEPAQSNGAEETEQPTAAKDDEPKVSLADIIEEMIAR